MGLPEPRFRRRFGIGHFRWPLAVLFSAGAAWAFWGGSAISRPDLGLPGGAFAAAPERGPGRAARRADTVPDEGALPLGPPQPRFSGAQKPPSRSPRRQGKLLGVVVKQAVAGPALVIVKDGSGRELRRLFDGELKPGKWRFEWDGHLEGGLSARPGTYRIAVRRGSSEQSQEVTLKQPAH